MLKLMELGEVSFGMLKLGVEILLWTLFVPRISYFCSLYGQEMFKQNINIGLIPKNNNFHA